MADANCSATRLGDQRHAPLLISKNHISCVVCTLINHSDHLNDYVGRIIPVVESLGISETQKTVMEIRVIPRGKRQETGWIQVVKMRCQRGDRNDSTPDILPTPAAKLKLFFSNKLIRSHLLASPERSR